MNMDAKPAAGETSWPALPLAEWQDTCVTLHMWTQIVGKIRLALAPMMNHWWQVPLYVSTRGLTTSPIPYGDLTFDISFDFIDHQLKVLTSEGAHWQLALAPRPVAEFYAKLMAALRELGVTIKIWTTPVEVQNPVPFDRDYQHRHYAPESAHKFWLILKHSDRVLQQYRCGFLGKCSPVHFFWGSFDLAVTRFSGRTAPPHPGGIPNVADRVTRLAYSHEVSNCGFWPGGGLLPEPIYYAYSYPEPPGYKDYPVRPTAAVYHDAMKEFVLPYEAVRQAADPQAMIRAFMHSTYEAAAERGGWERSRLEYSN